VACSIQSPRACATCARLNRRSLPLFTARSAPSTRVTPAIRYTTPLVVSSITSARHWAILRLPQRRQVQHGHFALEHVYAISFHSFKLSVFKQKQRMTRLPLQIRLFARYAASVRPPSNVRSVSCTLTARTAMQVNISMPPSHTTSALISVCVGLVQMI